MNGRPPMLLLPWINAWETISNRLGSWQITVCRGNPTIYAYDLQNTIINIMEGNRQIGSDQETMHSEKRQLEIEIEENSYHPNNMIISPTLNIKMVQDHLLKKMEFLIQIQDQYKQLKDRAEKDFQKNEQEAQKIYEKQLQEEQENYQNQIEQMKIFYAGEKKRLEEEIQKMGRIEKEKLERADQDHRKKNEFLLGNCNYLKNQAKRQLKKDLQDAREQINRLLD